MADNMFNLEQINELVQMVSDKDIGELVIEQGDYKIKIKAKATNTTVINNAAPTAPVAAATTVEATAPAVENKAESTVSGNKVTSPIVGTFYAAPSPDRDPFVKVGQKVKKGDVLFIIESMKLMNEIQSEFDGEVVDILCDNGQAVEFGQPIMVIR